eukprot:COSAG02_NODE_102_length_36716_cov_233.851025_10_plen_452_part_00
MPDMELSAAGQGRPRTPLTGVAGARRPAVAGRKPVLSIAAPPVTGDDQPDELAIMRTPDAASRQRGRRLKATAGYDAVGVHPTAFTYSSPPRGLTATRDAEEARLAGGSVADIDGGPRRSFADDNFSSQFESAEQKCTISPPPGNEASSSDHAESVDGASRTYGNSELSVESTLEALRHQMRGTPSAHETLVSVSQLQRRGQCLSDPARPYPDPVDPRSDEDFFCDLSAQLVVLDSSWRHQPHSTHVQSVEPVADPHGALLPAQLPTPRCGGPPVATVSLGALYLSPSDGELASTIRISVHGQPHGPPEIEVSPHDELGFWLERTSECIDICRRRGDDVGVSVRDANGRVAQSRGVAIVFGYLLWRRRTERGVAMAAEMFFEAARQLCSVWPGAIGRLCPQDAAQLITFALEMPRSKSAVRQAAGDWLAAAEADAATRAAALAAKAHAHEL